MPWHNISSRPTSRQTSQDPVPQSVLHSAGGLRSSFTHDGGFDDYNFAESSPLARRQADRNGQGDEPSQLDSQVILLEKESREFCAYMSSREAYEDIFANLLRRSKLMR